MMLLLVLPTSDALIRPYSQYFLEACSTRLLKVPVWLSINVQRNASSVSVTLNPAGEDSYILPVAPASFFHAVQERCQE
jgi:hypothetical protein